MRFVLTLVLGLLLVTAQIVTANTVLACSEADVRSAKVLTVEHVFAGESFALSDPFLPPGHVHNDSTPAAFLHVLPSISFFVERLIWFGLPEDTGWRPVKVIATRAPPDWVATQRLLI